MSSIEFENEFNILYNNIMSNAAPGLNSYEISVFLTKAQEEIIKSHFEPLGNKYRKGFDDSPKRLIDFSKLIKVDIGVLKDTPSFTFDKRAKVYDLPTDIFLLINEAVETNNGTMQVVNISYEEYTRLMVRPYKEPLKAQIWRIITTSNSNITVELIPHTNDTIITYSIRYIRKPLPIITADLSDYNVTIDGISTISECELDSILHHEIIQRAVELAKSAYIGDIQTSIELGNRSE